MNNLTEMYMGMEPLYINWVGALALIVLVVIVVLWIRYGMFGPKVRVKD